MRWLRKVGVFAVVACLATPAFAGDYHSGTNLRCADCHNMHFSQTHYYNPDGSASQYYPPLGGGGPFEYLLRDEINNLCLACHDGSSMAPDVLGANTGKYPSDVRNAGYLNRLGVVGLAATGHTLDDTTQAPGGTWAPDPAHGLVCTDCHHQHGYAGPNAGDPNGNYRNLQYARGDQWSFGNPAAVTYEIGGTPTNTKDVYEYSARAYDEDDMQWQEPDQTDSKLAKWCGGCHANFYGQPGDANIGGTDDDSDGVYEAYHRHPVGGADIGALSGGHSSLSLYNGRVNKVKVMADTTGGGSWDPAPATATPTCISCHKAHGNGNAFGLIFRSDVGTKTEDGDSSGTGLYEHLCGQCHTQASAF